MAIITIYLVLNEEDENHKLYSFYLGIWGMSICFCNFPGLIGFTSINYISESR